MLKLSNVSTRLFFAMVFMSGFTSIVYQMSWERLFVLNFGIDYYNIAAITSAFLVGLGIGAWLVGRIADRLGNALLLYGILELGIGLLAILSFFEIQFVQKYIIELQSQVDHALTFFTINFFITLAIILPSTILIGGTLPVMVKF